MTDYDALRTRFPDLGICVYGMEPGQPVTLELHLPDGQVWERRGATLADAIAKLLPPAPAAAPAEPPAVAEPEIDVFG